MRKYKITYKHPDGIPAYITDIFDDLQWKDYGVRVKQDFEGGKHRVIPYFSIYYIDLIEEQENKTNG